MLDQPEKEIWGGGKDKEENIVDKASEMKFGGGSCSTHNGILGITKFKTPQAHQGNEET